MICKDDALFRGDLFKFFFYAYVSRSKTTNMELAVSYLSS